MQGLDRRAVLGFGVVACTLVFPRGATAQTYGPTAGKELAPGVRQIDLGERESLMTEGELAVVQNKKQFTVKKGDVWTCAKGISTEGTQNKGNTVAIMRIIDLLTA